MPSPSPTLSSPRIRRSQERGHQDLGWSVNRMTFSFAEYYDPDWMHFGPLRVLIESEIEPHSGFDAHPHRDVEIVSYITSGVLRHTDSRGGSADISAGEMQLISAGHDGMIHSETNPLDRPETHYQMWFIPDQPHTDFAYHQLNRSPEERDGALCLYVSPDGRKESMPINTDAFVYAGEFDQRETLSYPLRPGRGVWIQVVEGHLSVRDISLKEGDGAGFTAPSELTLSMEEETEVLLVDVRMDAPRIGE